MKQAHKNEFISRAKRDMLNTLLSQYLQTLYDSNK